MQTFSYVDYNDEDRVKAKGVTVKGQTWFSVKIKHRGTFFDFDCGRRL